MRAFLGLLTVVVFMCTGVATAQAVSPVVTQGFPAFQLKWGTTGTGDSQFHLPQGVGVDGSGNVYVADATNNRVQEFDSSGAFVRKWGASGSGDGQFDQPEGLAVDGSGNVYVADSGNKRVQKFDSSGTFLTKWGSNGTGDGQFQGPYGIATDGSGHVFVTDVTDDRVQKFDSTGAFLGKWGTSGSGDGQFDFPEGVGVDGAGNVYVADTFNDRVQKFDSSGAFLTKWGSSGTGDGELDEPVSVAGDGAGNVYVADLNNGRVQLFDSSGTFLGKWGTPGSGDGQFNAPFGIGVDGSGDVYVADSFNDRVQKFEPFRLVYTEGDGAVAVDPLVQVTDADSVNLAGATVAITGNYQNGVDVLAVADQSGITGSFDSGTGVLTLTGSATVAQYQTALRSVTYRAGSTHPSTAQRTISFTASDGTNSNTVARPVSVAAVDNPPGLSPGTFGTFELKFGSLGSGDGQLNGANGIAVDGAGNVYVADTSNNRVEKFDSAGAFVTKWGSMGGGDGQFNGPEGLALDGSGNVYVADTNNNRVQKFDSSGAFLGKWGSSGSGNGQFTFVQGLAVDGSGNVYTTDTNNRVQKFDSSGAFVTKWGSAGTGDGQFSSPVGLGVDRSGNVYVVDTGNSRVQKFDPSGAFLTKWGSSGTGDGQFASPAAAATDAAGNVYVTDRDNARVEKFDPSGTFLGQWGSSGSGDGQFVSTEAVAVDRFGNVFVTDFDGSRVQRFGSSTPSFTEGDAALGVDPLIDVADVDSANLTSATVQITSGFRAGQDVLSFTSANGITGSFVGDTLTLSGTATVAQYETALRSVTFNSGEDPGSATRTVAFRASSGSGLGNTVSRRVAVTPVSDPPLVTTTPDGLTYTEGDGQVVADPGLSITDVDSANLTGATVAIGGNFVSGQDALSFAGGSGITGSYDSSTGVLTLTGTATVADYQAALRSVKYENTSQSPSGTRTVSFQVTDDSSTASNAATRGISLVAVPDAPVITTSAGATAIKQRGAAKVVDGGLTVSDADDANLVGAQVRISTGFQRGDRLSLAHETAISGTYDPRAGVLTLTGFATVAEYEAALRAVKFRTGNAGATKTVEFTARDLDLISSPATKALAIRQVLTLSIVDSKVRVRGARAPIRLRCQGPSGSRCKGTLTLVPSSGRASKAAPFNIAAGTTKPVSARTPVKSRAQLASRHKAVVRAVARTSDGRSVSRRVTLVGP